MNSNDRLSAFIGEKSKLRTKYPHRKAFEPRDGEASVFVTTTLDEASIWSHADQYYSVGPNAKKAIARGDLTVQDVVDVGSEEKVDLRVVEDDSPPLHANIVGFPEDVDHEHEVSEALARRCGPPVIRPDTGE